MSACSCCASIQSKPEHVVSQLPTASCQNEVVATATPMQELINLLRDALEYSNIVENTVAKKVSLMVGSTPEDPSKGSTKDCPAENGMIPILSQQVRLILANLGKIDIHMGRLC